MSDIPRRLETIRQRLRFFDLSLDCLGIASSQGQLVDLNRSWEEILGFDRDELKSRPFIEWVHPDDRDATIRKLSGMTEALDGGVRLRNRLQCRDGSWRWMMWSCRPVEGLVYMVGRDIRWLASAAGHPRRPAAPDEAERGQDVPADHLDMRYAHRRQRFFDFSLDLLCIADQSLHFVDLNPSWERTLGHSLRELMSKPFTEFVHPRDQAATLAEAARLSQPGHYTVGFANRYRCKDGSYRWLHWYSRVVGEHFYAVARDITPLVSLAGEDDVSAHVLLDPEAMREDPAD